MIYFFDKSKEDELKKLMEMAKNGKISQKQDWNRERDEESQQNAELPVLSLTSDLAESSGNQVRSFPKILELTLFSISKNYLVSDQRFSTYPAKT